MPDEPVPDDSGSDADVESTTELSWLERRRKLAFTGLFVCVLLAIVAVLAYATVRDPGPQPTVPPHITGTDDGSLKRAIVHYVGALESGDVGELVALMATDDARSRAQAASAIDEFSAVAGTKATVKVQQTDAAGTVRTRITFVDGRAQTVTFTKAGSGDSWHPAPDTLQPLATPSPTD